MTSDKPYRIRFYRTLVNDSGHPCNSTVEVIEIHRSKTPQRAVKAAMKRFERHQHLPSWDRLAHGFEVVDSQRPVSGGAR